jgi:hypothetical protein
VVVRNMRGLQLTSLAGLALLRTVQPTKPTITAWHKHHIVVWDSRRQRLEHGAILGAIVATMANFHAAQMGGYLRLNDILCWPAHQKAAALAADERDGDEART